MGSEQFLAHLQHLPWYEGQVVHVERMAARSSQHAAPATPLARAVAAALQLRGVRRMFTHQAAAIDHLLQACCSRHCCLSIPRLQPQLQAPSRCPPTLRASHHAPRGCVQGRHTVVATSTASGKSLCYLVPIMQALAQASAATRRGTLTTHACDPAWRCPHQTADAWHPALACRTGQPARC